MKDKAGNIRYYGANPNNYIYFNCATYPNTNCELWRIIGIFDNKVKLVRDEFIGYYSWDNKNTSTGAETDSGKNDWTTARLMKLLNPSKYYTIDSNDNGYGQSLYWNSKSGTCFSGSDNKTTTCDFTSTGIKNDTTRNLISEATYYLGGTDHTHCYPNVIYEKERGTSVYPGRPTTWTGKIALMYPSDYGYATDLSLCYTLDMYDDKTCKSNNYLLKKIDEWLLTSSDYHSAQAHFIDSDGRLNMQIGIWINNPSRPVLFLNSNQKMQSTGNGSSTNPYRLSVN